MTFKPVKTKCFIKFLESKGCTFEKKRNGGSHYKYKCEGCKRSITLWANKKTMPPLHVKTNCQTLGITTDEYYTWEKTNC